MTVTEGPRSLGPFLLAAAVFVCAVSLACAAATDDKVVASPAQAHVRAAASATTSTSSTTTTTPRPPTPQRTMTLGYKIAGDISPKSVDASGHGLVFAQNMMYKHTISVYDSAGKFVKTIPDTVNLASYGFTQYPGAVYHGAPVELAVTPDNKYAYVSNYSMYGQGFGPEGTDTCTNRAKIDASFVYRIDLKRLEIDQVIAVGKVPKYVAVTPDGKYVVVSNWCSFDESIIDTKTAKEIHRIPIGPDPRGIAVTKDSKIAYVAEMGGTNIAAIHLDDFTTTWINNVGSGPRHLVLSPDDRWLYATLNGAGRVIKIDTSVGRVAATVATGSAPRSMAISSDGLSLYVVNYESSTVTKVRADDMKPLQTIPTAYHPIGITYDHQTGDIWVACYVGIIEVFHDQ